MSAYCINSPHLKIHLQMKVFDADIPYPSNTIMSVFVDSDGFCAVADMDIDIKEFALFVDHLSALYTTLNGSAKIQEPFGKRQFIEFSGDGKGHIHIFGVLNSSGRRGFVHELKFENCIDQTYLPKFIGDLSELCNKYRQSYFLR